MEENSKIEEIEEQESKQEAAVEGEIQPQDELTPSEREELEKLREEKARSLKEKMYDKVTISVKTMDRIILVLVILFLVVVIAGIIAGR